MGGDRIFGFGVLFAALSFLILQACGGSSDGPEVVQQTDGGMSQDGAVVDPDGAVGRIPDATVVLPPEVSPLDETCATALSGPHEGSMPAPSDVVVIEDDFSARLSWDGPLLTSNREDEMFDSSIEGYRVCWGPSREELRHAVLTTTRMVSVFGVPNDEPQVAVIQAVDMYGRVSEPSEIIEFSGDSSRVDALEAEMTGFFDRFNNPGAMDEKKWNVAFSQCNDLTASHTFVSERGHATNVIANNTGLPGSESGCDRDQNIARPRAVFDFTDREGRIVFDMDGADGDRHTWYLDVFPYEGTESLIDITGHVTFDEGHGDPGRFLRFSQAGSRLKIHQLDATGNPVNVVDAEIYWDQPESQLKPGETLRHVELRVRDDYAAMYIDGQLVIENTDIQLDFEQAYIHWAQFAYNPAKIGRPWAMIHWDNFGFDGPSDNTVVHNYKSSFNRDDKMQVGWPEYEGTWSVDIPDSLEGATGARFFYTLQTHAYTWSETDKFVLNGQEFAMPEPLSEAGTWQDAVLAHAYPPASMNVEVPLEALETGTNTFEFSAENSTLLNMHVEVYFERGTEPSFTQPSSTMSKAAMPELAPIGPMAWINRINGENGYSGTLSGEVTFEVVADNWLQRTAMGHNLGVSRVEILVDGEVAAFADTDSAVAAPEVNDGPFEWNQPHHGGVPIVLDTTSLSNGAHELRVRAFDSAGNTGRPGDWQEDDAETTTFMIEN